MRRAVNFCAAFVAAATLVASAAVGVATAGDYPSKPIRLIVPWGAGGDTDAVMRVVAHYTGKHIGQPVVVVNMPGVGGTLGSRQGKDARPDGYTLTAAHESIISSKVVGVVDFDYADFIPLANLTVTPGFLVARGDAPWNSAAEMVADAKENPGKITFGATLGSVSHFFPLDIGNKADIDVRVVGYEGTARRNAALLGSFIDLGESNLTSGMAYFESNKLKPLGIATKERHPLAPEIPTLEEQGVNVQFGVHRGLVAPLGTPDDVVGKIQEALAKVAEDPEFIQKIEELGSDVYYLDAEGYKEYNAQESKKISDLAELFGIAAK